MKREIEFRVFVNLEMQNVASIDFINQEVQTVDGDISSFEFVALMQYAGLKDKNGTKIFEGDIVRIFSLEGAPFGCIVWDKCFTSYRINDNAKYQFGGESVCELTAKYFIVAGNIYENPELLETEK
jgi:uncharacterized phage protein (TIGR01671 family)